MNRLEPNTVHQGDCLELMKDIADGSVDMILADLPYGTTNCKWDTIIPFEPLWEQYKRAIKPNGAIVLTASQPFTSALVMSNPKMFKYEWIWEKNKASDFINANYRPMKKHENVLVFSKGVAAPGGKNLMVYNPQGVIYEEKDRNRKGSLGINRDRASQQGRYISKGSNYPVSNLVFVMDNNSCHPTQKPVALFEYLIKTYTNEGDLVLDNVAGSGTTGVACQNTGRNFILMEQEPEYVEIIKQRLANEQA